MVYLELGIFVFALILLIKSSNIFVEYAAKIAKRLGIKEIVIGLTLVAFGTSFPELVSSIIAASSNNTELVIGNIIGSNIANIGLILGITIIYSVLKVKPSLYKREFGLLLFVSFLFFVLALDGLISSVDGLILLSVLFIYFLILFENKIKISKLFKIKSYTNLIVHIRGILRLKEAKKLPQQKISVKKIAKDVTRLEHPKEVKSRVQEYLAFDILLVLIAGFLIYIGAKYVVSSATSIAKFFDIGSNIIGLTLFAIGTSLPELSVSISAVRKKLNGLIIGNIIGSNIANILLVGGVSAIVAPLTILKFSLIYSIPVMIAISLLLVTFARSDWRLKRKEGIILLTFYILFLLGTIYATVWLDLFTMINNSLF